MSRRSFLWGAAIIAAIGAAVYYYQSTTPSTTTTMGGRPFGPGAGRGARSTTVQVATATTQSVPTTLEAIGTVIANQTASIVSQITGTLTQVPFTEGAFVEEGTTLALIDTKSYQANLKQYQGQLAQNQANLTHAKQTLTRYERLFKQESIAKQTLDEQRALVKQYQGAVQATQGQIDATNVSLGYGTIKAPFSGFVGLRQVDIGNVVAANSTVITTMTQTTPIAVTFTLPQAQLGAVIQAQQKNPPLSVAVLDTTGTALAQGTLQAIDNTIDVATGTIKLKARFENTDRTLFPNQFVNVRLTTGVLDNAVIIPSSAIQTNASGQFVYKVDDKHVATATPITVGPSVSSTQTVVITGAQAGDTLVTVGAESLTSGSTVTIVDPNAPKNASNPRPQEGAPSSQGRSGKRPQ